MNLTIDALKNLYVAMGGSAEDVVNITIIPDMINAIATVAASVTSAATTKELPTVTAADAGSVLKVNAQGVWDKGTDLTE